MHTNDREEKVVGEAYKRDEVLENINRLLNRARSSGITVINVQHNEQDGMEP